MRWVDKKTLDLLDENGAFEFESVGLGAAVQGQDQFRIFVASQEQREILDVLHLESDIFNLPEATCSELLVDC